MLELFIISCLYSILHIMFSAMFFEVDDLFCEDICKRYPIKSRRYLMIYIKGPFVWLLIIIDYIKDKGKRFEDWCKEHINE